MKATTFFKAAAKYVVDIPGKIRVVLPLGVTGQGNPYRYAEHRQSQKDLQTGNLVTTGFAGIYSEIVPANKYWILIAAGVNNINRAGLPQLDCGSSPLSTGLVATGAGKAAHCEGRRVKVTAGTVVSVTDTNFVAADVVTNWLHYEEYDEEP